MKFILRLFIAYFIENLRQEFFFYLSQGGCISKLEEFILQHLIILGSVGLGIAFIQVNNIIPVNVFTLICVCCHITDFNLRPSLSVSDCRDDFHLLLVSAFKR